MELRTSPRSCHVRNFTPALSLRRALRGASSLRSETQRNLLDQQNLEGFAARGHVAAIGSSDFHGLGRMGMCRTYVFAIDTTRTAILDAIRARRTVVYGEKGRAYGDPALVRLAESVPQLRQEAVADPAAGALELISRFAGLVGLAGLVLTQSRSSAAAR